MRADRHALPLIVIVFVFDLDHFKQINDRFGHSAGDHVLKEFARHLNKAIRGSDFAVRTGGDEFLLVLPECPPEKVQIVLFRLNPFAIDFDGQRIAVSASRGWTQYQAGETLEQLTKRADESLYEDKQSRRAPALDKLTA